MDRKSTAKGARKPDAVNPLRRPVRRGRPAGETPRTVAGAGRGGDAVRVLLGLLMETSLGGSSSRSGSRGAGHRGPRESFGAAGVPLPQPLVTDSPSFLIAATV